MQSYANWYDKTHPSDQHKRCMDTAMRMSEYTEMYRKKYETRKIEIEKESSTKIALPSSSSFS